MVGKNGVNVQIKMKVTTNQNGQSSEYLFEDMGQFLVMGDSHYIKFIEELDGNRTPVTLKLNKANEEVTLIRRAEHTARFVFDPNKDTYTNYRTPAGIAQLRVKTNRLITTSEQQPHAGEVTIAYQLFMNEDELGSYQIRLRFTT